MAKVWAWGHGIALGFFSSLQGGRRNAVAARRGMLEVAANFLPIAVCIDCLKLLVNLVLRCLVPDAPRWFIEQKDRRAKHSLDTLDYARGIAALHLRVCHNVSQLVAV